MKTPHKHAEFIKAWADGAEIQMRSADGRWYNNSQPGWSPHMEYRIKPEPKPDVVVERVVCRNQSYTWTTSPDLLGGVQPCSIKGKLALVFDGETGKLKSASVINKD